MQSCQVSTGGRPGTTSFFLAPSTRLHPFYISHHWPGYPLPPKILGSVTNLGHAEGRRGSHISSFGSLCNLRCIQGKIWDQIDNALSDSRISQPNMYEFATPPQAPTYTSWHSVAAAIPVNQNFTNNCLSDPRRQS